MKKYNEYVAPEFSVVTFSASDVITNSVGYDSSDNWAGDVFPVNNKLDI